MAAPLLDGLSPGASQLREELAAAAERRDDVRREPLRLHMTQDGELYFDLELTEFAVGTAEELSRRETRRR